MSADIKEPCSFQIHISMTTIVQPYFDFYIQVSSHKQCLRMCVSFVVVIVFWSVASPSTYLPIISYRWAAFTNILDRKYMMLLKLKGRVIIPKYAVTNVSTLTEKALLNVHHFEWNQYPGPCDSLSAQVQNTNSHLEHRSLHNLFLFVCLFSFIRIFSSICLWVGKNL